MMLATLNQEGFQSWCWTIGALGAAAPVVWALLKLLWAGASAQLARREAMKALAAVGPVLLQVANSFNQMVADVHEAKQDAKVAREQAGKANEVSERTDIKVDGLGDSVALIMDRLRIVRVPTPQTLEKEFDHEA